MQLSIAIITLNEEANLARTLESARPLLAAGAEVVVVDNGSSDGTIAVAEAFGARVFREAWKGFAGQKNSAIEKCRGDWVLSLDADEAIEPELAQEILAILSAAQAGDSDRPVGYFIPRRNLFLGTWMRHGGFYPDAKLRLFRRGAGRFAERPVHEVVEVQGRTGRLNHALLHHAYPTLDGYLEHMNRYSRLGAELEVGRGRRGFSVINIVVRPIATFLQKYLLKLGLLDGREGLLLCLYHSVYVSWKYAKVWELSRGERRP